MIRILTSAPTPAWESDPVGSQALSTILTTAKVIALCCFLGMIGGFISIWGN